LKELAIGFGKKKFEDGEKATGGKVSRKRYKRKLGTEKEKPDRKRGNELNHRLNSERRSCN
jgi:hypothetical protein